MSTRHIKKSVVPGVSVIVFGVLLALMAVLYLAHRGFCASWKTETVDAEEKYFTSFSSRAIAVDEFNNPHMAYGGNHLYYAHFDGIEWQYETVDNSLDVGGYASIAIDSNNKVHISYHDKTNDDLKYATNVSGSWVASTIDSQGSVGLYTSIAIDSNNKVHISYHDNTNSDLKYATDVSGSWVTSTIHGGAEWVGYDTSIAIDSNNKVHISYHDNTNDDLKYATDVSGSWATYTIDSGGSVGWDTSIAIDSNNKVHISYHDNTNDDLKYATNVSGSWVASTVDWADYEHDHRGQFTSIAIDSNNKVHISYHRVLGVGRGDLKYATNASGSWVKSTIVDSHGLYEDVRYTSIAIDSNNKVHISYHELDNINEKEEIKYATDASGTWVTSTIDGEGSVGLYTSIAIDSNNKVHISYYASLNYDLKYATNASGTWVTSTIDSQGSVGWHTSIAIDSNNKVHISYHDNTNYDLKYATDVSGTWVTSTIHGGAGWVGYYTSIAIDSNNRVHISYCDRIDYGGFFRTSLNYTTNASGSWVISRIGSEENVGWDNSIAIDSNNDVHISYYDSVKGDLKYATNASGSWVTSAIGQGRYTSIAIDSNNKVHIRHYDAVLMYTTNAFIPSHPKGGFYVIPNKKGGAAIVYLE